MKAGGVGSDARHDVLELKIGTLWPRFLYDVFVCKQIKRNFPFEGNFSTQQERQDDRVKGGG